MKTKLFLSPGHSFDPNEDRGASNGEYVEGVLTKELGDMINVHLQNSPVKDFVVYDADPTTLKEFLSKIKGKVGEKDLVIELHFNSAIKPTATGAESIIPNTYTKIENDVAYKLQEVTADVLGIRARGNKPESVTDRQRLGLMHIQGHNIILEVCFISNNFDMKSYTKNKEVLAKELAEVLEITLTNLNK
jgi:N-acetylmuramoyl-L-alanine amidase